MLEAKVYNVEKSLPQRSFKDKVLSKFYISPDNIAYSIYPIAEFVNEARPDYIIALDRGGRITGFALYRLYHELYGSLPTQDHILHFKKISRRIPRQQIYEQLKPDVEKILETNNFPTVLVVDDWINTGRTRTMINQVFSELSDGKINVFYGVMRGWGKNVIGDRVSMVNCSWHNNGDLIGVEYSKETGKARSLRSPQAIFLRQRVSENVKKFAQEVKANRSFYPNS